MFRRPDVFGGVISLSGYFDSDIFFGGYCDDLVYANSPIKFFTRNELQSSICRDV